MKKLIYISFVFAILLAFTSCEKEIIEPNSTTFDNDSGTRGQNPDVTNNGGTKGGENGDLGGGSITDPDDDEDFDEDEKDNITDPDDDEDFDTDEDGK